MHHRFQANTVYTCSFKYTKQIHKSVDLNINQCTLFLIFCMIFFRKSMEQRQFVNTKRNITNINYKYLTYNTFKNQCEKNLNTFPFSIKFVSMTIHLTFSCQIILQKSASVLVLGPTHCFKKDV